MRRIAAAALLFCISFTASAVTISTSLGDYEVTTITGSFDNNSALLTSQVWWNDLTLANEFAEAAGNAFGLPNINGSQGVFFGYEIFSNETAVRFRFQHDSFGPAAVGSGISRSLEDWTGQPLVWAVATQAVPIPAAAWLFGSALAGLGWLRRKPAA